MLSKKSQKGRAGSAVPWPLWLVILFVLVTAGCGPGTENAEQGDGQLAASDDVTEDQQPVPIDLNSLVGSSWTLRFGGGPDGEIPLVDGWPITLTFGDDGFTGTAACNGYGGSYLIEGSQIRLDEIGITEAGCEPAVQQSEMLYMEALSDVDGVDLVGDELALSGMSTELIFNRSEPVPIDELVGTLWLLETMIFDGQVTEVQGEPASLTISENGSLTGGTGCRSLTGSYVVVGNKILLTDFAADGDCPTALFDQDSRVVTVLGDGFVPKIEGEALVLRSVGNEGLRYRAVTEDELSGLSGSPVPSDAEVVEGVEWIFAGGDGPEGAIVDPRTVDPERQITFGFDDGGYGGDAVCNSYGGEAEVGNGRLTLGPAASTKVGCGDPFNAIAAAYYDALPQMTEFGLEADATRLVMNGNDTELWFDRAAR